MTRRTANIELLDGDWLEIHPDDAARLWIETGDTVSVRSRVGRIETTARVTDRIEPGHVFTAFHFPEIRTNLLIGSSADVNTSCPEYKVVAVDVRPRRRGGRAHARARRRALGPGTCPAWSRPCSATGCATRSRSRSRSRSASTASPLAVTMRTPGHDEELALGFLYGEGLIDGPREAGPTADFAANIVEVAGPLLRDPGSRRFYTTSSCGVCGKGALEEVAVARAARSAAGPTDRRGAARGAPGAAAPAVVRAHRRAARDRAVRRRRRARCSCARTSAATTRWTR